MKKNITKLLVLALAVMSVMLAFASCGCSHEEKVIPAKDATCTAEGATEGKECAKCGEILVAPEATPKLAHTSEEVAKQEATCTEDGHEAGTKCSVCDTVLTGMEKIPAAHTPVDVEAKEETCAIAGHTAGKKCSVCNEILEGVTTIEPDESKHNIREVEAVEVKCLEDGSTAGGYCLNDGCNYEYGMETIKAIGHTVVDVERQEPTCTEKGYEAGRVCSVCGDVAQGRGDIPALGHTLDETKTKVETAPDLGTKGTGTGECAVCKEALELTFPALPGGRWNYENENDTLYLGNNSKGSTSQTLVTDPETGATYVNLKVDNPGLHPNDKTEGDKATKNDEVIVSWHPNLEDESKMNMLTQDNYFVVETAIRFNEIVTKWVPSTADGVQSYEGPENWYMKWLMNLCLSTNTLIENTGKNDQNQAVNSDKNNIGMAVTAVYDGETNDRNTRPNVIAVKFGGTQVNIGDWANIKVIYQLNEAGDKIYADVYVNNEFVKRNEIKDAGFTIGYAIQDIRIKFKNTRMYDSVSIDFDNTSLAEYEREYPYRTIEQALEEEVGSKVAFKGVVDEIYNAWNPQYNNCSVYVSNGLEGEAAKRILVYQTGTNLNKGDEVIVYGTVGEYNGTKQIAKGSTVEITKDVAAPAPAEMTIVDALAADVGTAVIIKGTVESIKDAWNEQYGNCSPFIVDEAGNKILVYRCTVNVAVGDVVTVTGYVDQYKGDKQIAQGSTVVVEEPEVVGPIEIGEGIYTGENEIAVTDTIYGTAITITRAGKYTIAPAEGETNADIMVNNLPVAAPYSFEVAEGASVTINVVTKDFQEGTVKVVIAEQE